MRVDAEQYRRLDLEVHAFLADVPLHDVWRAHLRGGGEGRDIRDVLATFGDATASGLNPAVRALFALRTWLGRVFGWDDEPSAGVSSHSYIERLPINWRERSLEPPGSRRSFWRVVYTFEHEALGEVINATVHAFLLYSLVPAPDGYHLYWAVYVKPVGRLTAFYMALIDPFRRWLVYPNIIDSLEQGWARRWATESVAE